MSLTPKWGITKMPPGEHAASYPDLLSEKLIGSVETEGARLAWSRACDCPCRPINDQTRQTDINCPLCKGLGVIYFGPQNYAAPAEAGTLTPVQEAILAAEGAAVIRGVIARASEKQEIYDPLGRWMWGAMEVTVRPENKIGYYDRLVSLDSEIVYFQTITAARGVLEIPLRYRATSINFVRSLSTVYSEATDYKLNLDGTLVWRRAPAAETIIVVHYNMHPSWRVIDHPHVIREIARRRAPGRKVTPLGTPTALPIMGHVRLEFLPLETS